MTVPQIRVRSLDANLRVNPSRGSVLPPWNFCYPRAAKMRAAAIFGLGSSLRDLKPFQYDSSIEWTIGVPAEREGLDAVLIFGGDGTVHRHLAALVKLGLPVLVVPAGSGNDFARALGIPDVRDSLTAWKVFVSGAANLRAVDLGTITSLEGISQITYFSCAADVGLDGEIARRANSLPR